MPESDIYAPARARNIGVLLKTMFGDRQQGMADALGVSQQAVSAWVREGKNARPLGERAARKIEEKLGLPRYSLDSVEDLNLTSMPPGPRASVHDDRRASKIAIGDIVEISNEVFLCTDIGERYFMAVNLATHTLQSAVNIDHLSEIEERFLYQKVDDIRKVGHFNLQSF